MQYLVIHILTLYCSSHTNYHYPHKSSRKLTSYNHSVKESCRCLSRWHCALCTLTCTPSSLFSYTCAALHLVVACYWLRKRFSCYSANYQPSIANRKSAQFFQAAAGIFLSCCRLGRQDAPPVSKSSCLCTPLLISVSL